MSSVLLKNASSVDQKVDAIVNAANKRLLSGGGVCKAIFQRAGYQELGEACSKIKTPLKDGDAVITPAFHLENANYIIHAVGPNFWESPDGFHELFLAYYNSLRVLKENNLHSISFPLISSGIYGGELDHPAEESMRQFLNAFEQFQLENKDYEIEAIICAFSKEQMDEILEGELHERVKKFVR